jgi:arabinofuranosyltransferase
MGYFGALVPNTALAKEAGMTYWPQGWRYLRDFVTPYALWLPLVPCLLWGLALVGRVVGRGGGTRLGVLPLLFLPPAAAVLHALYVVRVGGDFMHGRMLLPTLFALLLPLMVVAGDRWWLPVLPLGVVLPWAIVAALWLRPPYFNAGPDPPESVGREGIADERGFYVRFSRHPHPVTLADYEAASWTQDGHDLRHLAAQERGLLTWQGSPPPGIPGAPDVPRPEPLDPEVATEVVAVRNNIGLTGYAAGPRVHVVDRLGLADPIASRLRLARRGRPGHEKELPDAWVVARFGPQTPEEGEDVAAARAAMGCGDLGALLPAMEAPLTAARFEENLGAAWRLTALRFPADPPAARAELCPSTAPGGG